MTGFTRRNVLIALASTGVTPALSAPRAALRDAYWQRFGSDTGPDHRAWQAILHAGVTQGRDGIARFDYRNADPRALLTYIASLTDIDPTSLTQDAAFAYWGNLYNALTVQVVLSRYPIDSIRDVGGGLFTAGPWRRELATTAARKLSLDAIEHGILRPIWRDARIHYAVNCASLGCPDLRSTPYVAGNLSDTLDQAARAFINHPRGARVERGRLFVSSLYDWYKTDFGGTDAGVIAHLKRYAAPPLAEALTDITRVSGHDYDWRLNG